MTQIDSSVIAPMNTAETADAPAQLLAESYTHTSRNAIAANPVCGASRSHGESIPTFRLRLRVRLDSPQRLDAYQEVS